MQCWASLALLVPATWLLQCRKTACALAVPLAWATALAIPALVPQRAAAGGGGAPPSAGALRIVCANVHARNEPSPASLAWLAESGAGVVALVECSPSWVQALESVRSAGTARWPHVASRTEGRPIEGVALLSRYPIIRWRAATAPSGAMPHIDATIDAPGGAIRVLVVHPIPPESSVARAMRNGELAWIAGQCTQGGVPTVVVGDFNETPWGRAFAEFAESSGLMPASSRFGWTPTWPVRIGGLSVPAALRIPIDHAFVSPALEAIGFGTGPDIGSDHLPIVLDLVEPPR